MLHAHAEHCKHADRAEPKKDSIRSSMLKAGYKEKAIRLAIDSDTLNSSALNRAVFDFLSHLLPPDLR